jgi:hypothetical protein
MNRKFIFSMVVAMSVLLGSGFVIASQTAMAVQFSYPYSTSAYNKAYNNNTSFDDNSGYNKAYTPKNNDRNDRYSSFDDNSGYNKAYTPKNNDRNDRYSDSYSKSAVYSKYPTIDRIYECQKGPFEGFFTSSVEFCIAANGNIT